MSSYSKTAMTAIELSAGNDAEVVICAATDANIDDLRTWASECERTHGGAYGESHTAQGMVFRGFDLDVDGNECDWCVIIEG